VKLRCIKEAALRFLPCSSHFVGLDHEEFGFVAD
jgi:hypothetical protein